MNKRSFRTAGGVIAYRMKGQALEKRGLADIRAAIERAKAGAESRKVPLTAERLAAELGVHVTRLCRYIAPEDSPPKRESEAVRLIRDALNESIASVTEHALSRGTGSTMHLQYLKRYAGYEEEERENGARQTVIFGEDGL